MMHNDYLDIVDDLQLFHTAAVALRNTKFDYKPAPEPDQKNAGDANFFGPAAF
jgi:hypothetical protein